MTNILKFMLLTGKYLPDEDIQFDSVCYYFERFDEKGNNIYCEYSDGYWEKLDDDILMDSGNYNE